MGKDNPNGTQDLLPGFSPIAVDQPSGTSTAQPETPATGQPQQAVAAPQSGLLPGFAPLPVPQGTTLGAPVTAQPEDSGVGHRFLEGAGLPTEVPKTPQNWKELAVASFAPAVAAYHAARAPMIHAENLYKAIKDGDGEAAAMHLGNFLDSFIPGSGNAQQLGQETVKDVQEGNLGGVAGTATGLAARAALAKAQTTVAKGLTPGFAAREAEAGAAAEGPGIIKQVFKGEQVAQKPAEEALRAGFKTGGEEAGVAAKAQPHSLRTIVEEPTHALESQAKANYRQIDKAAGTDFKALNEKLENTEYQIRQLTETEEDVAREAQLEKARTATIDKIAAAKQQAIDNGVDPKLLDKADSQFKQASALKELETKIFKNPNIVSGNEALGTAESVNVDQAVKALQKLQDTTKYGGSRLEQALGKEGANNLLKDMYAAQRVGMKALSHQEFAIKLAKYGLPAATTAAGLAYELTK